MNNMKRFLLKSKSLAIMLIISNLLLANSAFAKATTWNLATGGLWTTAGNWTNGVPAAGDDITINGASTDITAVPTISLLSLTINGNCRLVAAVSGNLLTITGTFTVAGGVTFNAGTDNSSRLAVTLGSACVGTINGIVIINSTNTNSVFTNSGTLSIGSSGYIGQGATQSSDFSLSATGILKVASTAGISTTAGTGNIRVTGSRSYSAGSEIEYNGSAAQVTGNAIPTNTDITINNAAGVTLSVAYTGSGTLTMTSGTLDMANTSLSVGALTGSGNLTHASGAAGARTISVTGSTSPAAYTGVISNGTATSLALTKSGNGTLTLSGLNTYTGVTTISAGTISINTLQDVSAGASSLGAPTTVANGTVGIAGSGTLQYTGTGHSSNRVMNTTGDGATIDASGSGTLTLTGGVTASGNNNIVLTGSGSGSETAVMGGGSGTFTKNGTGTWTLSAANTFSGAVTISAGTVSVNALANAGVNSPLGTGSSTATITIGATGTLQYTGSGHSTSRAIAISDGASINASGSGTMTLSGTVTGNTNDLVLTGTGAGIMSGAITTTSGGVIKNGTNTWTLSGANTYTGNTTVNSGTLKAGIVTQAFGSGSNVVLANTTGVVLDITGFNTTIGSLAGGGINGGDVTLGAAALTVGNTTSTTYSGIISGTGNIIKAGTGTLALAGLNSYTGKTTISAGTLSINSIDNLGAANTSLGNPSTIANGTIDISATGTLLYTGSGHFTDRVINLTGSGASINASGSGGLTLSGNITGNTFNLVLTGTGGGLINGNITTTSGTLTKSGTGTWTLAGANTYTGATNITVGTLRLGVSSSLAASGPLGTSAGGTVVSTGAALDMGGFALTGTATEALTLNGTGVSSAGALTNSSSGGSTYAGTVALNAASSIGTFTGDITLSGVVSGANALTKVGAGTLILSAANTYTGKTTISAGTISINTLQNVSGGNNSLGNPTTGANGTIDISGTGTLLYTGTGHTSNRVINLTGDGGTVAASGSGIFTLTGGVTGNTFNLVLDGSGVGAITTVAITTTSGTLTKNGSGTWTLSTTNTFTGGSTLNAGTLNINNLQALGTVAGTFTINGGTIDNTSAGNITTLNYPLALNGDFTYSGSVPRTLSLGTGAVTINADRQITVNASTLTIGGVINNNAVNLTKASAGTLSFGASAVTLKGLTISAGTLVSTSATMNLAGDFTNNGTFTHSSGTVNFNGSVAQVIGGSQATTFNALIINNTAGVSLGNNETTNAALTLTNGILTIPTGNTLTIANGNAIGGSGFGTSKQIATLVDYGTGAKGFLRIDNMAAAAYLCPVGNGTLYLPVTITPTAVNTFSVCAFTGITVDGEPNGTAFTQAQKDNCVDAVWTVNHNGGPTTSNTTLKVEWPQSLEGINFQSYLGTVIGIAHYDAAPTSLWGPVVGIGNNPVTGGDATRSTITQFSPFGVGRIDPTGGVLAIKINYFNASKGNGFNTLNWQAACSSSQAIFELERSVDGVNFISINSITATQARCASPFSYNDNTAPAGTVFYRIRIIDVDGKASYSAIVKLSSQVKDIELSGIAPNPVMNIAQVKVNTTKKDAVNLLVIAADGKVVSKTSVQLQAGSSIISVDIANLPSGVYMLKGIFSDGQTNTVKFIKQ